MPASENLAPGFLALFCTLTGIATILVFFRLWTRNRIVCNVGTEDYVVALSMVLIFASLACLATSCHYGLGQHEDDLTHEQTTNALKFLWIGFNITPAAEITAKISITLMLMRVTTSRVWRLGFIFLVVTSIGITAGTNLTFVLSCRPLSRLWDSSVPGECDLIGRNAELYVQGAALYDAILALSPIMLLWNVQIGMRNKVLLCGLFALGCFTAVAGIVRITFTNATSFSEDPTFEVMPFVVWKCVELTLSVIVGCLPTLRPLFRRQSSEKKTSTRIRANYGPSPNNKFAIRMTTEIYVRSNDAESGEGLGTEWESLPSASSHTELSK